jgi:hypothetical protein
VSGESGGDTTPATAIAAAAGRVEQVPANCCLPGGKEHGAQRSVPCSGNEVFALLDKTGTGQCLVAFHRPPGFYPLSVFESDSPGLDTGAGLGVPGAPSSSSGPRSTWNHIQAQGSAPEILRQAVFLRGDALRGDSFDPGLVGGGDYRCLVRARDMDCTKAAYRDPRGNMPHRANR